MGSTESVHAGQQHRLRRRHAHQRQARLVLFGSVAHEPRPGIRAGNQFLERGQHLTAIAHAQGKGRVAREERRKFFARPRVEQDRLRPPFARPENIAVGKSAAGHQPVKSSQPHAAAQDIGHVHIVGIESRAREHGGHFRLAVDALFAQDGDGRARAARDEGRRHILARIEAQGAHAGPDRRHRRAANIPRARTRGLSRIS